MSRVGKLPIKIPQGVSVTIHGTSVKVVGPKGFLERSFAGNISFEIREDQLFVLRNGITQFDLAMWGTARSIIQNAIIGVTQGFAKELEVSPYRCSLRVGESYFKISGDKSKSKTGYIYLDLGKSHSTWMEIPAHISVDSVEHVARDKRTSIKLSAIDKEKLGFFASSLIKQRPLNPYKGHGIRPKEQKVVLKEIKKQK
jgi:large subunit ribosomal protein L6